jgi:hypothetical protein
MKKLALVFASLALAASPVLACPGHDEKADAADNAPRTAEKAKEQPKAKEGDKAKAPDKTAKPAEKKADKVSSK